MIALHSLFSTGRRSPHTHIGPLSRSSSWRYASTGKLTTKSDVYSYGVVLLELLTGRVPVETKRPPGEHVLVSWALPRLTNREKVMEMVDPALRGQYSDRDLIQVMLATVPSLMEMVDPTLKGQYSKRDLIQIAVLEQCVCSFGRSIFSRELNENM